MDVFRYADTSQQFDFLVPAMYRYRNWIIESFNADQPYDQFLCEQIAGDILAARTKRPAIRRLAAVGRPGIWPTRGALLPC
jgi:hypothetical protein